MTTPNGEKPFRDMTKRELIACAALEGYLAASSPDVLHPPFVARAVVAHADAVLEALGEPKPAPAADRDQFPNLRAVAVAAMDWLRAGAPGKALAVLEEALQK